MEDMQVGAVVRWTDRIGVVIDAAPLSEPTWVKVRWEPLLSGEVTTGSPDDLVVVPLRTVTA